jgi:acyl carrier protein
MHDLTQKMIEILRKYAHNPASPIARATSLIDLDIDALDLPMIFLDVEDVVGVQITFDEERDGFATVGDLVACVDAHLLKAALPRQRVARPKRGWMSA